MKWITTKLHGLMDYAMGICMILSAFLFDLGWNEKLILLVAGVVTLAYSAATNYDWGLTAQLSVKQHLRIDVIFGLILCLLPTLTESINVISLVECFGVLKITTGMMTSSSHKDVPRYPYDNYKRYEMPVYGKFEKFPSVKW